MADDSNPNIEAKAKMSATEMPAAVRLLTLHTSPAANPSPAPPVKRMAKDRRIIVPHSRAMRTSRTFAPISIPRYPNTWMMAMRMRVHTHHWSSMPV